MKKHFLFILTAILIIMGTSSCKTTTNQPESDPAIVQKVSEYATFRLSADLSGLSVKEREIIPILIRVAEIMDDIFWMETYGAKNEFLAGIKDSAIRQFARINYGPWEILNENKPFITGAEPKPLGAQFYPQDMTREEFEKMEDSTKSSLYTVIRRNKEGQLSSIPYHVFFSTQIMEAADLINQAAAIAENEGLKKYLELRAQALLTDDYFASDMAWMDMKSSNIDFVVGPIENYEDALFGYKAAHESFVLIKDAAWSQKLARFAVLLPALQKSLPVEDKYKQEVPGMDSDLGVYDAVYYAGDCNSGSKTIAINLPNDERVQIEKGSRKLQLKNSIQAKFEKILIPISQEVIDPTQQKHVLFDAFFENIMFHEVAHGLGIKNTLTGAGPVRKVLSDQYSALEEAKADIIGLYLVSQLAAMGEFGEKNLMDNYVTFLAGIFRSVRFGATSSHGKGNMLQFNFFNEKGAFSKDPATGLYRVEFEKMKAAVSELGALIIGLQGDGNYAGVKKLMSEKGMVPAMLQDDLGRINSKGIPKDIVFEQGAAVLGL
ncbi:MAG: Zn-dependent hydrolase [Bacteroidetes bacterium GWF2_49_14]|nr:MAG: Zn-dependent hydrolase [Bacteroidetes bacterium GWF2_49_14]HBB90620.1 Zn-dependent hydrolase [Bacteroidales bacterium]